MKTQFLLVFALSILTASISAACRHEVVPQTESEPFAEYRLSNPSAAQKTKAVYRFLCENYGKKIISGQQESTWMGTPEYEMEFIRKETGKTPALRGLDFMNDDFNGVTARAKDWWNRGGLVTICWHAGIYGGGYNESKNDAPDFRHSWMSRPRNTGR